MCWSQIPPKSILRDWTLDGGRRSSACLSSRDETSAYVLYTDTFNPERYMDANRENEVEEGDEEVRGASVIIGRESSFRFFTETDPIGCRRASTDSL